MHDLKLQLIAWLCTWTDVQQLGWNNLGITIGFVGTIFFSFFEGFGLASQGWKLWSEPEKKGAALSVKWMSVSAALFIAIFFYGESANQFSSAVNGLFLVPLYCPILFGLYRFKGFSEEDWNIIEWLLAALVIDCCFPFATVRTTIFMVVNVMNVWMMLDEPKEMNRLQSTGVVDPKMLMIFVTSSSFWIVYAAALGDWVLTLIAASSLAAIGYTMATWWKWHRVELAR